MAKEKPISCARPTGGVVGEAPKEKQHPEPLKKGGAVTMIQAGKKVRFLPILGPPLKVESASRN